VHSEGNLAIPARVWSLAVVRGAGDAEVARIAELQHGLIHAVQLAAAGLSRAAIRHRLQAGRLHTLYSDVYVVGRPVCERLGPETAAVMHFSGAGLLSGESAAWLWELADEPGDHPAQPRRAISAIGTSRVRAARPVTVTLVGRNGRSRPGLLVHRAATLELADIRRHQGLPVTAPARTMIDFAASPTTTDLALEQALAHGRRRRLLADAELGAALNRAGRRAGVRRLRRLVAAGATGLTRSQAEGLFLQLVRDAGLPAPRTNVRIHGLEVDFAFDQARLVVEIDGFAFHGDRASFERDRARDQRLLAAGYRVIRFTWRQLHEQPLTVIARLVAALSAAA
jgi:very-short-patch-repair endonuclease